MLLAEKYGIRMATIQGYKFCKVRFSINILGCHSFGCYKLAVSMAAVILICGSHGAFIASTQYHRTSTRPSELECDIMINN